MTFANCPKCGASDVTTAGVCANCGWTRFPQVTVSYGVYETIGELEIKMSGKALLDDYKRLLFENNKLTARIAELENEHNVWLVGATNEIDRLNARIAELEAEVAETRCDEIDALQARIAELKVLIDDLTNIRNINDIDEKWWDFVDSAREELMR